MVRLLGGTPIPPGDRLCGRLLPNVMVDRIIAVDVGKMQLVGANVQLTDGEIYRSTFRYG